MITAARDWAWRAKEDRYLQSSDVKAWQLPGTQTFDADISYPPQLALLQRDCKMRACIRGGLALTRTEKNPATSLLRVRDYQVSDSRHVTCWSGEHILPLENQPVSSKGTADSLHDPKMVPTLSFGSLKPSRSGRKLVASINWGWGHTVI